MGDCLLHLVRNEFFVPYEMSGGFATFSTLCRLNFNEFLRYMKSDDERMLGRSPMANISLSSDDGDGLKPNGWRLCQMDDKNVTLILRVRCGNGTDTVLSALLKAFSNVNYPPCKRFQMSYN